MHVIMGTETIKPYTGAEYGPGKCSECRLVSVMHSTCEGVLDSDHAECEVMWLGALYTC